MPRGGARYGTGPKPKPVELHEQEGTRVRSKYADPKAMAVVDAASIDVPDHLNENEAAIWQEFAPRLKAVGLLTEADIVSFEVLVYAVVSWREAKDELADSNLTKITAATGNTKKNPLVAIELERRKAVLDMLREFGMTPSSRTRVIVTEAGEASKDALEGFFD